MTPIHLGPPEESTQHECESYREGDWLIFRCPICQDYERQLNWRTGEMRVSNPRDDIHHFGKHVPPEYKAAFDNRN